MVGILIRIKPGHQIEGEGEGLGKDSTGESGFFWRKRPFSVGAWSLQPTLEALHVSRQVRTQH